MCKDNNVAPVVADTEVKTSKRATSPAPVADDAELFAGVVKSYNERRGFGFLACDETAKRYGRDVYLSKVESSSAMKDSEDTLKEGDHVVFAVVPSEEGFPQAAAVQRLHLLQGTVQHFCKDQGGTIVCNEDAGVPGTREIIVKPSDCGCLTLYPGDEVRFCIESAEDGMGAPEAKLLRLLRTCRPPCALLSCFLLEFPRPISDAPSVILNGHAFGTCICFSGLPSDLNEVELNKLFGRFGATQVTAVHSQVSGCASVQFPDVSAVARFLTGAAHAFTTSTDQATSQPLVAKLRKRETAGDQNLPALSAPSMVPGDANGVLICWEPLNLAASYLVEIRTVGAEGWSPVDCIGRVQPAGAAASLGPQQSCLAVAGLSAGVTYEARVSYVASCGCTGTPSDPSMPCTAGFQNAVPLPPSYPVPQPLLSYPQPQLHPSLYASSPCSQLHTATMQMHGTGTSALPPSTAQVQSAGAPPHQMPYSFCMPPEAGMQPTPTYETPVQPGSLPPVSALPLLQAPQQPELRIGSTGTSAYVTWHSIGPSAASYVVDLRESTTAASNRFVRMAPVEVVTSLELCIQGLEPGRSYTVCVCGVGKDGIESPPSPWSPWLTLPVGIQQLELSPYSNMPAPCMPSVTQQLGMSPEALLQTTQEPSLYKPEKQISTQPTVAELAPEVTGQEVLFLD